MNSSYQKPINLGHPREYKIKELAKKVKEKINSKLGDFIEFERKIESLKSQNLNFFEEISWGQHIFRWQTPSFFSNLNHQNETNIHNISSLFNASSNRAWSPAGMEVML